MRTPEVRLLRLRTGPQGTFGLLQVPGLDKPLATVECEWLDNRRNRSCVPADRYLCVLTMSPRLKRKLYILLHVPARSGIRFHVANWARQLKGCIAVGLRFANFDGDWGVACSATALRHLHKALGGEPFWLTIQEHGLP